uniref:PH domain-containing protein n=1 Tax=Elaeophora elaphi TaxID=1147741 RepID=A0A0R3RVX9_9BILA
MGDFQRKLKEGEILRYRSSFLGKKWKECWVVLFSDSEFIWYDKKGDSKPAGSIFLKDFVPYTCVGPMCDRMPVRRPELPPRYSLYHLVGIGMDSQASKVHWFLFSSDSDLESWFTEITKTLPKPNPPPAGASQQLPASGPNAPPPTYNPPPVYPNTPPQITNTYPNQPMYNPATNSPQPPVYPSTAPQPPMYPSAAPNYGGGASGGTTVIIKIQDNDTYITNNYYGGGPENRGDEVSGSAAGTVDSTGNQDTVQDYYGGYDIDGGSHDVSGGYDVEGGDYDDTGGYDIGGDDDFGDGDDFGGGDFSGGDW